MRIFKFDYDAENDSLFIYNPKSKSKASIELDNLIIDFNTRKAVSAIEFLDATTFFSTLSPELPVTKELLQGITECRVDITPKENMTIVKLLLVLKNRNISTPLIIPTITETNPSLAAV